MRLPFPSLRANLIAAFVAVIAVSLLLASGAFAYLLREYQVDRERDRLEVLAVQYTQSVVRWARSGSSLQAISAQLDQSAGDSGVRVLLIDDRGTVLHDTDNNSFAGRTFALPPSPGRRPNVSQGAVSTPSGDEVFTVVSLYGDARFQPGIRVAVVAPEQSLTNAWREALPRLSMAALSALLVSIVIAWWLASTITRPMVQITRASEEMARGNLDPHLTLPETTDEVGRLSKAFTTMAREVARSHRTMRDLLANVSHDLRTPLTSISGFAGALVDGTLSGPDGAREAGRIIGEEAERMRRLVEDLLYLSRIESGDLSLQRDPVNLAELARAVQARFLFRAHEVGISFEVEAPEVVTIMGDPHRLGQVLDNLVENAFKYTPPTGKVRLTVAVEDVKSVGSRSPRPQRMATVSVHNTGSYIPPEEAERVFERFYQVDKARAGSGGSGLGLAIAREIVQAHGGRIELESSTQTGTRFSVRIPTLEQSAPGSLVSSEPARPAEVGAARR
ncbi:MAG TPA: HAMP domain-containing sensor histidine kinase [Chloroflexota bacterium]|nr:HAMP domain-containing sensor histidine kinase [Chloroflexota bacterium]